MNTEYILTLKKIFLHGIKDFMFNDEVITQIPYHKKENQAAYVLGYELLKDIENFNYLLVKDIANKLNEWEKVESNSLTISNIILPR